LGQDARINRPLKGNDDREKKMSESNMKWTELTVLTTSQGAEIIAQALVDCGSYGAAISDRADIESAQRPDGYWDMIDPSMYDGLGEGAKVTGYFRQDASFGDNLSALNIKLAQLKGMDIDGIDLGELSVSSNDIGENDWVNCWKKFYKPTPVGERLVIKPSWEEYAPKEGDLIIHMDPGGAFGTGTHETTSMCLELAEKYVKKGDRVIDVGCGTAILSIAAILLGAKSARAIDIDLMAVDCARENVAQNGMEENIQVLQGDLLSGSPDEKSDLIFANIVADVIIMLAPDVPKKLKKGGHLICSGIIKEREDDVRQALESFGFSCEEVRRKGEWVAMCWKNA
jgi:ribosomal protein L11 methyltransferase